MRIRPFAILLIPLCFACDSLAPEDVALEGDWIAPNAYSGCSVAMHLVEQGTSISGSAVSTCPSPGTIDSPVTGTRSGATFDLMFAAAFGGPSHTGRIQDQRHLTLDFSLPDGVQRVRFSRGAGVD